MTRAEVLNHSPVTLLAAMLKISNGRLAVPLATGKAARAGPLSPCQRH